MRNLEYYSVLKKCQVHIGTATPLKDINFKKGINYLSPGCSLRTTDIPLFSEDGR